MGRERGRRREKERVREKESEMLKRKSERGKEQGGEKKDRGYISIGDGVNGQTDGTSKSFTCKYRGTVEPLLYDHPQNHIGVVV